MTFSRYLSPLSLPAVFVVLLLLLAASGAGLRLAVLDLQYSQLSAEIGFWGRDGYMPEPALRADVGRGVENLLSAAPRQPEYLALLASYQAWQAHYATDVEERIALNNLAMFSLYRGLESRPAHRHGWSKMVEYASRSTVGAPVLQEAGRRLERLQYFASTVDASGPAVR